MVELLYPLSQAPVLKGSDTTSEMLPVVEPAGIVTGQASRSFCHSGSHILHPVVHLQIINRYGQIFLQKRSETKDLLPGRWDTAVGGHVSYGESIEEALRREVAEELSFYDYNPVIIASYINETEIETELVSVFAAVGNFELDPHNDEVSEGRYWDVAEIEAAYGKDILTPNFEAEFKSLKDTLLALL